MMRLKIRLLTFFSVFSTTAFCAPITAKITTGSENAFYTPDANTNLESMTLRRPDDINKPPTGGLHQDLQHFDEMLGDQPLNDDGFKTISVAPLDDIGDPINYPKANSNDRGISSTIDPAIQRRIDIESSNGLRIEYDSDKHQRLKEIQNLIPVMIGRSNVTDTVDTTNSSNIDIANLPPIEKIISFRPKCNAPKTAKDNWKEENLLHLYFNVSYNTNATLASAIIKLHRLPTNQNKTGQNNNVEDEEKLLRVSIYWYSKQGKKQRTRKWLCDSKVVTDKQNSVELNVRPAVTSWMASQNLGFAIKVENQEEAVLKATNYFKGDDCKAETASAQTPVNTNVLSNTSNEMRQKILENYFLGTGLLPIISICTVESITGAPLSEKSINCQLHQTLYNQTETEGHRRVQSLIGNSHHLRHQKHLEENPAKIESHFKNHRLDIRNLMENKTMYIPKDELIDRLNAEATR